jgi:D-galactose 1-dehydrogenase
VPVRAEFEFLHPGTPVWDMRIATDRGTYLLSGGGAALSLDGAAMPSELDTEYREIYRRFLDLVARRACDADLSPLALTADCFMLGRRRTAPAFGGW